MRKILAVLAATGMALSPAAANAGVADALSLSRVGASMSGASFFQDAAAEDDDDDGSTAVILGVVLIVLIGAAAISGGGELSNSP